MNRTLFRGVTAGIMSGALLTGGTVAATMADGADASPPSSPPAAPTFLDMPKKTPPRVRPKPKPKPAPRHRATRSHLRRALTGSPRTVAHAMVLNRGWSEAQFGCLDRLWQRESGWSTYAANSSGAYGIPQALPGSKMASFGSDWRSNPITQIRWGLWYIANTYGSPCAALAHSNAYNYY